MPVCFLRRERKSVDLYGRVGRERLGGNGERENTIRIYCLKKISVKNIEKTEILSILKTSQIQSNI